MQHEPGREPTEPTDALAEYIRAAEELADAAWALTMARSKPPCKKTFRHYDANNAYMAAKKNLDVYLSGARPMPDTPAPDEVAQLKCNRCSKPLPPLEKGEFLCQTGYICRACWESSPKEEPLDEVAQLRAEVTEQSDTIARQFELLKAIANVLKGQAGETELWSHADIPEMATRLTARVADLEAELAEANLKQQAAVETVVGIMDELASSSMNEHNKQRWYALRTVLTNPAAPGKEPTSE